ncbi:MAG: hypothetical protein RLP09_33870 [Sandaracinaceae bacterium]
MSGRLWTSYGLVFALVALPGTPALAQDEAAAPLAELTQPEGAVTVRYVGRRPLSLVEGPAPELQLPGPVPTVPRARLLCPSACTTSLPPGIHTFALTNDDGAAWVAFPPLQLRAGEPLEVDGHLHDHGGDRLGGQLFALLGPAVGLAIGTVGAFFMYRSLNDAAGPDTLELAGGAALLGGGGLTFILAFAVGLPLMVSEDRAWVTGTLVDTPRPDATSP